MEDLAGSDVQMDIKVSRRASPVPGVAHAADTELVAGVHTGTDADLHRFSDALFAGAAAGTAGLVDGLSLAAAGTAGLADTEKSLGNSFHAGAAAVGTALFGGSLGGAAAFAVGTAHQMGDLKLFFCAVHGIFKVDGEIVTQVLALNGSVGIAPSSAAAEKGLQN